MCATAAAARASTRFFLHFLFDWRVSDSVEPISTRIEWNEMLVSYESHIRRTTLRPKVFSSLILGVHIDCDRKYTWTYEPLVCVCVSSGALRYGCNGMSLIRCIIFQPNVFARNLSLSEAYNSEFYSSAKTIMKLAWTRMFSISLFLFSLLNKLAFCLLYWLYGWSTQKNHYTLLWQRCNGNSEMANGQCVC